MKKGELLSYEPVIEIRAKCPHCNLKQRFYSEDDYELEGEEQFPCGGYDEEKRTEGCGKDFILEFPAIY